MTEAKDVRIQLLLSKSEAEAIDEWRYSGRVPNRNEAIRRLVGRGIEHDAWEKLLVSYVSVLREVRDAGGLSDEQLARLKAAEKACAAHLTPAIRFFEAAYPDKAD